MDKQEAENLIIKNSAILTVDEALLLFELAKKCQGDVVEIGSYLGGSTVFLAKGLRSPFKIFSVDSRSFNSASFEKIGEHFVEKNPSAVFNENIKREGIEAKVVSIEKTSKSAAKSWKKPICLLWIDGDHSYAHAKQDFLLWEKFLTKSGTVAFHDSFKDKKYLEKYFPVLKTHPDALWGPKKVVLEAVRSKRYKIIGHTDSIIYLEKTQAAGLSERAKTWLVLFFISAGIKILNPTAALPKNSILEKIDRHIGRAGHFLKRKHPKIYYFLKRLIINDEDSDFS